MRRLILGILTVIVLIFSVGPALLNSLTEPQITNQLELYQSELFLQARELETGEGSDMEAASAILGDSTSLVAIANTYAETRQSVQQQVERLEAQLKQVENEALAVDLTAGSSLTTAQSVQQLATQLGEQRQLSETLGIQLGILDAVQGNEEGAIATWQTIPQDSPSNANASNANAAGSDGDSESSALVQNRGLTAQVLMGIWSDPPRILPDAEPQLRATLDGWFLNRSLERLYELQQRPDALQELQTREQAIAQQTVVKLGLLGTGPALGCLVGATLFIVLIAQRLLKGKDSLLAESGDLSWETPWPWDITWQVLLVGFFFLGQIILPITVGLGRALLLQSLANQGLGLNLAEGRITAISTAIVYLLMSVGALTVLYYSIKPYLPLSEDWFRLSLKGKWPLWGVGGYLVAVPLVIGVSLVNQQFWQGRGGSNPLLEIVLNEGDTVALGIFFFTAAIAAPIFEEILFRGFLLPSLTRYMPVWGAIGLSAIIFATAHLSFSEVLPLAVLGVVLGFVYTRSRNLLASMLVHSLWNSATMVGLLILGSGID
ncbi:MAG: type II CAAX endopeptidase family protein [Elainellaceae cyanobacterium]